MKRIILVAAILLGAAPASAHETEWKPYAGASLGQNQFEDWALGIPNDGVFTGGSTDEEGSGFGAFFGVEPYEYVGFELGYHDFGEARLVAQSDGSGTTWAAGPVSETLSLTSIDISMIGRLPFAGDWALFGRVGASYYDAEWTLAGTLQPATPSRGTVGENKHQSPVFGAGIEYRGLGAWSLVATYLSREFELPNQSEPAKLDSISLAAAYRW